ncbi:uncharacterized protein LOC127256125 [Andrographis paniculata]|uniref:uncharacterized protein LOC127256125 n=1 Tax=Andrographis paniculata TaxID=175694 RepID=UPI0021E779EB|nr:uncharacterized protein LOC127256125 [Andrographis paniculata]
MGTLTAEICLISARGLRRSSSCCWNRLHWYAVAWIHPDHKFCTKIDAPGTGNPLWNTTFAHPIPRSQSHPALHVEVYSREPVFLRQTFLGSATVPLNEFLEKHTGSERVGSFQLRTQKSDKAVGFVDISIRISDSEEAETGSSPLGANDGFDLTGGSLRPAARPYPYTPSYPQHHQFGGGNHLNNLPPPPPPPSGGSGPYCNGPWTPSSYISMPSSVGQGRPAVPGFGMGAAAGGALAAGTMIYGGDIMSGLRTPGASLDASVSVSAYPPF